MGKLHPAIDDRLRAFIEAQRVFFVATGPLAADGHLNLSPKGLDSFRVIDGHTAAYLDYVGSGAETIAHLRENARIVIMFCAFDGPPNILRLHGRGEVVEPQDPDFAPLRGLFPVGPPARAVVRIRIQRIGGSCGYGVPRMRFQAERPQLPAWCDRKGEEGLVAYQRQKNARSVDGLSALRWTDDGERPTRGGRRRRSG